MASRLMKGKNHHLCILGTIVAVVYIFMITACDGTRYVDDGSYLLRSVKIESDNKNVDVSSLDQYVRQHPNGKWLSVFKVPLGFYSMSGPDTTKWNNRVLRKWGQAPVVFDSLKTLLSATDLTLSVHNRGYLNACVTPELKTKGKRADLVYHVESGEPYIIRKVEHDIQDATIDSLLRADDQLLHLHSGQIFSIVELNDERNRITNYLADCGYYQFNKEFITFDVDTSRADRSVNVLMHLKLYRRNSYQEYSSHPLYKVRDVVFEKDSSSSVHIRRKVLEQNSFIVPGNYYSASDLQKTYNKFARLQAVRYTNIRYKELPDSQLLDCNIHVSPQKSNSVQFQPEGTNTAGDFGAAATLTYQNRNLFHGSEVLNLSLRGAFEAIHGLEGYQSDNYEEYNVEATMLFPRYLLPGISRSFQRKSSATSEATVSYNLQNRPEFHRRVFTGAWRYKWAVPSRHSQYKIDVIDVNFISMPWISDTFKKDYLESESNRNAILRYNYEDLLIMKFGLGYTWSLRGNSLRINVESAGNLLNLLDKPLKYTHNDEGQGMAFGIAYAQYAKFDVDYVHTHQFDESNTLAWHARFGLAYPYGNSTILPFEKRYIAGGANSVRGWSVRSLGPGGYKSKDGRIDFINQTGDIRLDLSVEMRTKLFWKFQGAMFVDAGNIWTLREYEEQPEGQFRIDSFWKQIAVAYGIGIRLNFDYFIIRLDMGMKAINPMYTSEREHYSIIHPRFSRDHAFHFAVGLPF